MGNPYDPRAGVCFAFGENMTARSERHGRAFSHWRVGRTAGVAGMVLVFGLYSNVRAQDFPNGVAAGDVDHSSVVLWARASSPGAVVFEYGADPNLAILDGSIGVEVVDPLIPAKVEIDGLADGTQYYYRAIGPTGAATTGTFRTPHSEARHGLRFGVSGDWRGELRPYVSIANLPSRDLDFFVALGDTIYADVASIDFTSPQAQTLDDFRIKHNEAYSERFGINALAAARASTAFYADIDDHEVTNDFSGGAAPQTDPRFDPTGDFINETELYSNGLQVFHEYNPIREEFYLDTGDPRTAHKRRLYRFRTFGHDAALFVVDARSFRDEPLVDFLAPPTRRQYRDFLERSFDPSRTMLGAVQLDDLLADLQIADEMGVTWKFVLVPEPIQNFGPILAGDRFEGYAFERSEILGFVDREGIENVVFVAADIHGTVVNNLVYRPSARERPVRTRSFEITTGSVAYAPPFGPTIIDFAPAFLGEHYAGLNRERQDRRIRMLGNVLAGFYDFPRLGLAGLRIPATLREGSYVAANTYGWTEFSIDAAS